jgi:hypothetical protein
MKDRLEQLAAQYGSDKASLGYMPLYEEFFKRHGFTPENVRNVLEIGTNKGSSLRVWAELFPNAIIYGIDITRTYEIANNLDHPNIKTFLINQGSKSELEAFTAHAIGDTRFDIIIDDGSHDQSDQQTSLSMLFGYLRRGGLYVVEDLITGECWWDGNLYNRKKIQPTRNVLQELQRSGKLPQDFPNGFEIEQNLQYCEYRESNAVIYDIHHPQIAFMGRL